MSELQLWLLGVGVLIVLGVAAFNKWQEIQLRRRTERAFGPGHSDVLLDEGPATASSSRTHEPASTADVADDALATNPKTVAAPVEHHLGLGPRMDGPVSMAGPILDARLDFIATVSFSEPRNGEEILRFGEEVERAATKPVRWEGVASGTDAWTPISPSTQYSAVRAGLQMVDRAGQISEDDLIGFCEAMQGLGATMVGRVAFPGRGEALKVAETMDAFCADVDIQVGLNVLKPDGAPIKGAQLRSVLEGTGCKLDRDGKFQCPASDGSELCVVTSLESRGFTAAELSGTVSRGLTVVMDVPRVSAEGASFSAYSEFAVRLAQSLGGVLMDDNHQPVSEAALHAIATQVAAVRERMREQDIPAGSALALRLFA